MQIVPPFPASKFRDLVLCSIFFEVMQTPSMCRDIKSEAVTCARTTRRPFATGPAVVAKAMTIELNRINA